MVLMVFVALRKESVDRNTPRQVCTVALTTVALRKESVDRNARASSLAIRSCGSLSARRAWIEIAAAVLALCALLVALRKESVDRNGYVKWKIVTTYVALRKESVDRNQNLRNNSQRREVSLSARRAWIEM